MGESELIAGSAVDRAVCRCCACVGTTANIYVTEDSLGRHVRCTACIAAESLWRTAGVPFKSARSVLLEDGEEDGEATPQAPAGAEGDGREVGPPSPPQQATGDGGPEGAVTTPPRSPTPPLRRAADIFSAADAVPVTPSAATRRAFDPSNDMTSPSVHSHVAESTTAPLSDPSLLPAMSSSAISTPCGPPNPTPVTAVALPTTAPPSPAATDPSPAASLPAAAASRPAPPTTPPTNLPAGPPASSPASFPPSFPASFPTRSSNGLPARSSNGLPARSSNGLPEGFRDPNEILFGGARGKFEGYPIRRRGLYWPVLR